MTNYTFSECFFLLSILSISLVFDLQSTFIGLHTVKIHKAPLLPH